MLPKTLLLALIGAVVPATAETVLGVAVYSRHGDSKIFGHDRWFISVGN